MIPEAPSLPLVLFWREPDDPEISEEPVTSERPDESCLLWSGATGLFVVVSGRGYGQMHFYNSAAPMVRLVAGAAAAACGGRGLDRDLTVWPASAHQEILDCVALASRELREGARPGTVTRVVRQVLPALAPAAAQLLQMDFAPRDHADRIRALYGIGCDLMVGRRGGGGVHVENAGAVASFSINGEEALPLAPVHTLGAQVLAQGQNAEAPRDWQMNVVTNGVGLQFPKAGEGEARPLFDGPSSSQVTALEDGDRLLLVTRAMRKPLSAGGAAMAGFPPELVKGLTQARGALEAQGPPEGLCWGGMAALL